MAKAHTLVVHKSLISWIISKNRWLQALLVVTAIIAVFANVLPLEMQPVYQFQSLSGVCTRRLSGY